MEIELHNYIIDIDGTLLDGTVELNNSLAFLTYLKSRGAHFLLATNSIKSHESQVRRLEQLGVQISLESIYTPIDSINQYIESHHISHVYVVGSQEEISQIKAHHTLDSPELIICLDFEKSNISYGDLQLLIDKIHNSCPIMAASQSPYYLVDGKKRIDTGAFVALLESIIERKIPVFGKPSSQFFLNAQLTLGCSDDIIVIGDDWSTDILGAKELGFRTALVKSGKYLEGDELKCGPDFLLDDLSIIRIE